MHATLVSTSMCANERICLHYRGKIQTDEMFEENHEEKLNIISTQFDV